MTLEQTIPVVFVGIAERCTATNILDPLLPIHIQGLRHAVQSIIYPAILNQWILLFLVRRELDSEFTISIRQAIAPDNPATLKLRMQYSTSGTDLTPDWMLLPVMLPSQSPIIVIQPGTCLLEVSIGEHTYQLGKLPFVYTPSLPLTTDEIRAIKANPSALKFCRMKFACSKCEDSITALAGIERPLAIAAPAVWHSELPDIFQCRCQQVSIPLRYLRESLPGLLRPGVLLGKGGEVLTGDPLYTDEAIARTLFEFLKLLDEVDISEEDVQQFLEDHPLLFASFSPRHIYSKPPILNKYRADFGLVTPANELILVEIEHPSIRLQNRTGDMYHDATHALGQLRDWKFEIDKDRDGFLRLIPDCPRDILRVRYLLIAGRDKGDDASMARKLIATSSEFEFMTYDHFVERARASAQAVRYPFLLVHPE